MLVVERGGLATIADASRATDASPATDTMNIFSNAAVVGRREVEVDDMHRVLKIKTASVGSRGNKDGLIARTEVGVGGPPAAVGYE